MALTKLSVGKTIELSFSDRQVINIDQAKVILLRDGKDLESELTTRNKKPNDLTFTLSRTLLGEVEVAVEKVTPTRG